MGQKPPTTRLLQNAQHLSIISHLQYIQSIAICPFDDGRTHRVVPPKPQKQDDVTMRHFTPNILASLAAISVSTTLLMGIL
jgi:hypothetical protein